MNNETIEILNIKQATAYIKHGLKPIDVYVENGKLIFAFNRIKSKPLYDLWCKYQLN